MTRYGEWYIHVQLLDILVYVKTCDDTTQQISKVGKVPSAMPNGGTKYLACVLHVPNITKNLVFVGKMVERAL